MPRVDWGTWFLPLGGPRPPPAWYSALLDAVVLGKPCVRVFFPMVHVGRGGEVGASSPPPAAASPSPGDLTPTSGRPFQSVRTLQYDFRFRDDTCAVGDRPRDFTVAMEETPDVEVGAWWRRRYVGDYGTLVTRPNAAKRDGERKERAARFTPQPWRDALSDARHAVRGKVVAMVHAFRTASNPTVLVTNVDWYIRTWLAVAEALMDAFLTNMAAFDAINSVPPSRRSKGRRAR